MCRVAGLAGLVLLLLPAASSASVAVDYPQAPQNSVAPAILGSPSDGSRLTASPGEWGGMTPMAFAYRWRRCADECTDIAGATRPAYTLTSADVGARMAVRVTATNAAGSATADSAASAVVVPTAPTNITRPVLAGTASDGELLSTTFGRWTGTEPMTMEYGWRRCDAEGERCDLIDGAMDSSYRLTAQDVGATIRARVTATNVVGSTMRSSLQTVPVEARPLLSISPPAISGVLRDGSRLAASPGEWDGSGPITFSYAWRRCAVDCSQIAGATGASYQLISADVGASISVAVTANAPGGRVTAESSRTDVVAALPPANITRPAVSGVAAGGEMLATTTGRWTGTAPFAFQYQWRRCDETGEACDVIPDATESTYRQTAADVGFTLRARVVATNLAGSTMRSSLSTPIVDGSPLASADPPELSGTPRDGLLMRVSAGTWTGSSPTATAYQWRRCRSGAACTDIAGATAPTYRLSAADVGAQLQAVVTASNAGSSVSASSGLSEVLGIRRAYATAETTPVNIGGDGADDIAIWPNAWDPARSLVVGTTKAGTGGLSLYEPFGSLIQYWADGKMDNVDVRDGFPLAGQAVTLVAAGSRSTKSGLYPNGWIALYRLDPVARKLVNVAAGTVSPSIPTYGSCLYRSPRSGRFYYFVVSTAGDVEQYELSDDGHGRVTAVLVRSFGVGSISEGCVADDERGLFYLAQEDRGIWRYDAEPDSDTTRTLVDPVGSSGHLKADVEGLALTYEPDGGGYLIASSQGDDTFAVYRRRGDNAFVRRFEVADGVAIDGVAETDGVDATSASLGSSFPRGAFIAHDGFNGAENQNYKFVPLEDVVGDVGPE
jgi:3-phytase